MELGGCRGVRPTSALHPVATMEAMAKIRRNEPCPCGSGSKAKRCCYGNNKAAEIHCLPTEFCKEVTPDLVS